MTLGVGRGVGVTPITVRPTLMVTGEPTEGVMVTVAEYEPGFRLLILTENVTGELAPALSLPPRGAADNQLADGRLTVQPRLPLPVLLILIV